ncbi:MAG: ABC transporter permease [Candidatus Pacearchaeota archaeon]
MIKNYLLLILRNFSRRKLRGWLTILGILIGIAAVVALISIAQGLQDSIARQFEKMGTNKLIIMPGSGGAFFGAFAGTMLTEKDLSVVKNAEGVDIATEMFFKMGKIKFKDETKTTYIIGFPTDDKDGMDIILSMTGFEAEKGRQLKEGDRDKVVIGYRYWSGENAIFSKNIKLKDKVQIEGRDFEVVGLIKRIGNPEDDAQVYIPIKTAREIFDESDEITYIYVQTKEGYTPNKVAEIIKKDLRDSRDEKEGEETFSVQTFEQLMAQFNQILGVVGSVLVIIALISLIVGGIGIMNTMYTSVLERTREIGIMKAVGAKNWQIMWLFILESGFYGVIGGAIGVALGFAMGKAGELVAASAGYPILKVAFPLWLIFGSLLFAFLVGAISGLAPARTASRLKPVEALRYE